MSLDGKTYGLVCLPLPKYHLQYKIGIYRFNFRFLLQTARRWRIITPCPILLRGFAFSRS